MSPKAIFFDLDGTLVDSAPDFFSVVNDLRAEDGLDALPYASIREQVSNGGLALACLTWQIQPDHPHSADYRLRLLTRYSEHLGQHSGLFDGFDTVLNELRARGIDWGIVTNKPRQYAEPLLERLRIQPPLLICPEDVTKRKPHPEPLLKAAAHFGHSACECLYVGDHLRDIESAIAAQMPSVAALFGYIEAQSDPYRWGADYLIHSPVELLTLLNPCHPINEQSPL